jgi:hypothetical protein
MHSTAWGKGCTHNSTFRQLAYLIDTHVDLQTRFLQSELSQGPHPMTNFSESVLSFRNWLGLVEEQDAPVINILKLAEFFVELTGKMPSSYGRVKR